MIRKKFSLIMCILFILSLVSGVIFLILFFITFNKLSVFVSINVLLISMISFYFVIPFVYFYSTFEYTDEALIHTDIFSNQTIFEYKKMNTITVGIDNYGNPALYSSEYYYSRLRIAYEGCNSTFIRFTLDDELIDYLINVMPEKQKQMFIEEFDKYKKKKEKDNEFRKYMKYP